MRKLLSILLALPFISQAQDCKNFYLMSNNSQVVMTIYDKKGKESGTQTWKITEVNKNGNALESKVNSVFKDEKGKEISTASGVYKCENGVLKADLKMSLPQQQMEQYKDAQASLEPVYVEYPSSLSEGQSLSDADMKMDVQSKGLATIITYKVFNRKVSGKESVTTPAGTWQAYVINFESLFKIQMGGIGIPMNISGKEWFVPGVGIVKSESYSKGDKLVGSSQITSITK